MAKKSTDTLYDRYKKSRMGIRDPSGGIYIHALKSSYAPIISPGEAKAQALIEYRRSTNRFKSKAAKNLGVDSETALNAITQMKDLMSFTMSNTDVLQGKTENPSAFKPLRTESKMTHGNKTLDLTDRSFQAIASSITNAKNRGWADYSEPILENANLLSEYIKSIEDVIEDYASLQVGSIAQLVLETGGNIPNAVDQIANLPQSGNGGINLLTGPDGTQKTSLKNLVEGWKELVEYASGAGSKADAKEIMRKAPGWMKGIGGQGMEVMAAAATQSAEFTLSDEMKKFCESVGAEIIPSTASSSGEAAYDPNIRNYHLLNGSGATRKGDVNVAFRVGQNEGSFEMSFGMSLKQKKLKEGKTSKFDAHTGNYKNFLIRANSYGSLLEYDLMNSLVHMGATGNPNYLAYKSLLAARGAVDALAGVQTREDMAYLLVFSNKVISMYDYLNSMTMDKSDGGIGPLALTIKGDKNLANINRKVGYRRQDNVDPYIRSRKTLQLMYSNTVTIKGQTPSL